MDLYLFVKTLHILSSTILFGTGIGIAFFMFRSHFTDNIQEKFYPTRAENAKTIPPRPRQGFIETVTQIRLYGLWGALIRVRLHLRG
ncbi:MAG: DUF2269 family protein [Alphaproteobacteria bacterium]|nr:DUF2269 family protein [Alphaproteobacteria bacterium]